MQRAHSTDSPGPDARKRFLAGAAITEEERAKAVSTVTRAGSRVRELVAGRIVVVPAAASAAPAWTPTSSPPRRRPCA